MKKLVSLSLSCLILSGCEVVDFAGTDTVALQVESKQDTPPTLWRTQAKIQATMSLYYLFDQSEGPFGEIGDKYVPATISIPEGIRQLKVQASSEIWGWGNSKSRNISDANGGYLEATRSEYHSSIQSFEEFPVGSLVGMWSDGTENDSGDLLRPFYIGSEAELDVPAEATALVIGMHDGYEWSNNWGSRTVTLQEIKSSPLP